MKRGTAGATSEVGDDLLKCLAASLAHDQRHPSLPVARLCISFS